MPTHSTPVAITRYNPVARTVDTLNASGGVVSTRPYTAAENTAADAQAHSSQAGWDPVSVPALWALQP